MSPTRFSRTAIRGAAAGLTLLTLSLIAGADPASAREGYDGFLRVTKDCSKGWTEIPGSTFCEITRSNLPELPPGSKIYYNQPLGGPTAGPGFVDSTIFVYVNDRQWAVGRCTAPNDDQPGLCTLSDGVGPLAGLRARIVVTARGNYVYAWTGPYRFDSFWGR